MGTVMLNDPVYKRHLKKSGNINLEYLNGRSLTVQRIDSIVKAAYGKILDLGCNRGIVSILMARKGYTVTGLDFLDSHIKKAIKLRDKESSEIAGQLEFIVGEAEATGMLSNQFDTVVIGQLLEHVGDPRLVLKEAKRVLKTKGRVLISVPVGYNRSKNHIRWFSQSIFRSLVEDYFKVEKMVIFEKKQMLIIGTKI